MGVFLRTQFLNFSTIRNYARVAIMRIIFEEIFIFYLLLYKGFTNMHFPKSGDLAHISWSV
jgi:hypothetical protein